MNGIELLILALEGKLTKEFILEENIKAYVDTFKRLKQKEIEEEQNESIPPTMI